MFVFNENADEVLMALGVTPQMPEVVEQPESNRFEEFKHWAMHYVQEHDNEIAPNHQIVDQIQNSGTVDEIEAYLRDMDYCDDCFLKMYRRFASGEQMGCGCGEM